MPTNPIYYPSLVSVLDQGSLFSVSESGILSEYDKLSQKKRSFLHSEPLVLLLEQTQVSARYDQETTASLSRLVRSYILSQFSVEEFEQQVTTLFSQQSFAIDFLSAFFNLESGNKSGLTVPPMIPSEMLPLAEGLSKYPQMGQQLVTKVDIVTKEFMTPLTPTVLHWIEVYEAIAGVGTHSSIDRGEFLYRSQPCRGLPEVDRIKLAQLLGAHDDKTPLKISTEKGGIIWQKTAPRTSRPLHAAPSPSEKQTLAQKSSAQKPRQNSLSTAEHSEDNHPALDKHPSLHGRPRISQQPTEARYQRRSLGSTDTATSDASLQHFAHASSKPTAQKHTPSPLKHTQHIQEKSQQPLQNSDVTPTQQRENVNFSSGQTLPVERAQSTKSPKKRKGRRDPFHIKPIS